MIGFLRKGKHQFQSVTDLAKITCKYFYENTIEKSLSYYQTYIFDVFSLQRF